MGCCAAAGQSACIAVSRQTELEFRADSEYASQAGGRDCGRHGVSPVPRGLGQVVMWHWLYPGTAKPAAHGVDLADQRLAQADAGGSKWAEGPAPSAGVPSHPAIRASSHHIAFALLSQLSYVVWPQGLL